MLTKRRCNLEEHALNCDGLIIVQLSNKSNQHSAGVQSLIKYCYLLKYTMMEHQTYATGSNSL